MAANVLGGIFPHAQIVALTNSRTGAGHTVGRVWSNKEGGWLYFDLWGQVSVYRLGSAGEPIMLAETDLFPGALDLESLKGVRDIYNYSATAVPFNEYPQTLAGFIYQRLVRAAAGRTLDSFEPAPAIYSGTVSFARTRVVSSLGSANLRREYMQARFNHLFGERTVAQQSYARLAILDGPTLLGAAAGVFAKRLDSTASLRSR
jgi:hypothetical protein